MSKLQLLSGPAVEESMQMAAVRQIFRYQLNQPTIGSLLVIGLAFFIGAAVLWFGPGLGGGYTAAFLLAILLGMTFFSMASFWGNFRQKHFIAIADDFLFVGNDQKAWQIHWSLVDSESLNFDELQLSRFRAKIYLQAAGQEIELPLFTPFVFLEDIEGLMFEVLKRLDSQDEEALVSEKARTLHGDSEPDVDPEAGPVKNHRS